MRLGIDFGTTRIVVAAADRGNYPIVTFEFPDGESADWFSPLVAVSGVEKRFGRDAHLAQQECGWTVIRSLKRYLEEAGPETSVEIAGERFPMLSLLVELASSLRAAVENQSNLGCREGDELEIMLGVPANANGNQRFLTLEAFRRAGFSVLGLLNEPSAAAIEFTHSSRAQPSLRSPESLLVYDLGGGTFDASLVATDQLAHSVLASEGIPTLGGDDFDSILAELALESAGISHEERDSLSQAEWFRLHEECRQKKEALSPNSRRIIVELETVRDGWETAAVSVSDFYDRCRPLVDETVRATVDLIAAHTADPGAVYVTGGGSQLPLVPRALREAFGRRVRRSSYTHSATAIGLAIQAEGKTGYVLRDTFTRYFGVWREADAGRTIIFDPLFEKGTPLPGPREPSLRVSRVYQPVHNIGHFRYLECTERSPEGRPDGDITVWDELLFPFDPGLRDSPDLSRTPVGYSERAGRETIEEIYTCDSAGAVTVTVSNHSSGYERTCRLGRWAASGQPLVPGKRRRQPKPRK